ncbi:MAG TPA: hypothetical protein VKQ36_07585 [Ktedonobacterales bacterium]|nr:hypothetical protein [Ktedonobacterales bacterium]
MVKDVRLENAVVARALQVTLIAFFVVVTVFLLVIYAIDPAIYVQTLLGKNAPVARDAHPLIVTAFLLGILAFVGVGVVGVVRRWRWVFWLLLIAFMLSFLVIPGVALELAGIIPAAPIPLWYGLTRMATGAAETVIGVWMILIYRRYGVWARGRRA